MITVQPLKYQIVIHDLPSFELTLDDAQELCAALMAILAPTLDVTHQASTQEVAPFVPPDMLSTIKTLPDATP